MKLISIKFKNYKTISEWQEIHFDRRRIALNGSSGCGKVNVLKAACIALKSITRKESKFSMDFELTISIDKDDFKKIYPQVEYSEENSIFKIYTFKEEETQIKNFKIQPMHIINLKNDIVDSILNAKSELKNDLLNFKELLSKYADKHDAEKFSEGSTYSIFRNGKQSLKSPLPIIERSIKMIESLEEEHKNDHSIAINQLAKINKDLHTILYMLDEEQLKLLEFKYDMSLSEAEQEELGIDTEAIKDKFIKINTKIQEYSAKSEVTSKTVKEFRQKLESLDKDDIINKQLNNKDGNNSLNSVIYNTLNNNYFYLDNITNLFKEEQNILYDFSNYNILELAIEKIFDERQVDSALKGLSNMKKLFKTKNALDSKQVLESIENQINSTILLAKDTILEKVNVQFDKEFKVNFTLKNGQVVVYEELAKSNKFAFNYAVLKTIMNDNDVIFLDEPFANLCEDLSNRLFSDFKIFEHGVVVYSTHDGHYMDADIKRTYDVTADEHGTRIVQK